MNVDLIVDFGYIFRQQKSRPSANKYCKKDCNIFLDYYRQHCAQRKSAGI